MKEFRSRIAAKPDDFLKLVQSVEAATGQAITAEHYKHPAKCENPDLERFYLWKAQIGCTRHEDFGEEVFSPRLSQRVAEFFDCLMPLYDYFNQFKV